METQGERAEPARRAADSTPGATTMKIRRKDNPSEPTGDTLTLEREHGPELAPFPEADALDTPVVAFEARPVDTTPTKGRLGHVLVSRGVVTESQVAAALKAQAGSGKRLGEVLVDIGALDERGLADALADFFGMPVTDLRKDTPEPCALALVPAEVARENLAIPLHLDDDGAPRGGGPAQRRSAFPAVGHQRALGPAVGRADDGHPVGHRPQLPGPRQRRQARAGLRSGGERPQASRRRGAGADARLARTRRSSRWSTTS